MDLLIKRTFAVTMNPRNDILDHADVAIRGDRITYVGPSKTWAPGSYERVIDGEQMILIPGLINAHYHSTQSLIRGMFYRYPLEIWRQYFRGILRTYDWKALHLSALLGCIEMLRTGVTTVLDHFDSPVLADFKGVDAPIKAYIASGMRAVVAYTISDRKYEDTIPLGRDHLDADSAAVLDRITADETKSTQGTLSDCKNFLKAYREVHPRIFPILGPSAPQRCSDELLISAKRVASETGTMLHIHVGETRTQALHAYHIYNRRSLIQHLRDIGFLGPEVAIAHGIWISEEDVKTLAEDRTSVVHNPASNLKLGSGLASVRTMLRHGVNVAVATDGAASNDSLNMFEAMKLAALIHNLTSRDFNDWVSPLEALRMGTTNAAKVCGLQRELGSIEEGKAADLVLLKRASYPLAPLNDAISQLVFAENGTSVATVIVAGDIAVESGRLTRIDENKIYSEAVVLRQEINEGVKSELKRTSALEPDLREMYVEMAKKEITLK
jgi:5-methylthioadenosine/S-adenosylhomocysteine deaminase